MQSLSMDAAGEKVGFPLTIFSDLNLPEYIFFPSPDGSRIMLVNNWGNGVIFNTDTGKFELLPGNFGFFSEEIFNWFPDNHKILIRANYRSLWLADLNNGEYMVVAAPGIGDIDGAAASPDGRVIVYSHSIGTPEMSEIWLVGSNGRDSKIVHNLSGGSSFFSWSPDGKQIVFLNDGWMVMNADGKNLRQLGYFGMPASNLPCGHQTAAGLRWSSPCPRNLIAGSGAWRHSKMLIF